MDRAKLKPLTVPLLVFVVIAFFGFFLLEGVGLALFNVVFGNEVHVVIIKYHTTPDYDLKGNLVSLFFDFNISLGKEKVPIETILCNYRVSKLNYYNALSNVPINLHILVYVANRIKLFEETFNFEDADPRQITIYLHRLNPQEYSVVHVEINGYYQIGESQVQLNLGGEYPIEG